jgi:lipoyl synthase
MSKNKKVVQGVKLKGADKVAGIPIKVVPAQTLARKPSWIRAKAPNSEIVRQLKSTLRENNLYTVCEEAACPNLGECFSKGTATFMIMGDICTRRCPFCDVGHGRPNPLDKDEPYNVAKTIQNMKLRYVVLTSVDRDDLRDGGAQHFVDCIDQTRKLSPEVQIEILTPDFRGRMDIALDILSQSVPDVFNHNLESVPRLYKKIRPGADYQWSLNLLKNFKQKHPEIPTKSGIMLGLGEEVQEVEQLLRDLRSHDVNMLTLGQYLQPSRDHLAVDRYVTPDEFKQLESFAYEIGFDQVASGPMVRSSYHADIQASGVLD